MHFLKQNFSTTKTPLLIFFMVVFSIVYDIDFWKNKFGLDTARHAVRRFQGTDKSLKNDIQNNNTNTVKPNMHQRLTVPLLFVGTVATKYSCCFILCLVNLIRGEVFLYCLMQKHLLFSLFFFAVWQGSLSHETLTWENKHTISNIFLRHNNNILSTKEVWCWLSLNKSCCLLYCLLMLYLV